jgi:hypothetical protein
MLSPIRIFPAQKPMLSPWAFRAPPSIPLRDLRPPKAFRPPTSTLEKSD